MDGRNLPWPIGSGDTRTEETRTEEKSRRDRPVYGGVYGIPRRPTDDGLRLNSTSETTTTKAKATKVKGKKKGGT